MVNLTRMILRMPTDCAPTQGTDKKSGWTECIAGTGNSGKDCLPCIPDEKTRCGKMMRDGGFDSVPKACFSKCCVKTQNSLAFLSSNSDRNKLGIFTSLGVIGLVILIVWLRRKK